MFQLQIKVGKEKIWLKSWDLCSLMPRSSRAPMRKRVWYNTYIQSDFLVVLNEHVYVHCIIQPVSRVITWSAFPFCCANSHAQNRSALQIAFMPHDSFKSGNLIGLPVFRTCWLSTTKKSDLILCKTIFHAAAGASWGSGHETRIFGNARILNWEEPISDCAHRSDEIWAVPSLQLYLLHRISK